MRRPIRQPDPKPLPPEVDQALDDYLFALVMAALEAGGTLQNHGLTSQTVQGDNTAQAVRPSGHPRQGAEQETSHGEAEG